MLETSKKFLFYSLMMISTISFINIIVLYWFPIQFPLSSYLATSLMITSYFLENYYLIPISFLICVFIFFTALSFLKQRIFLPAMLLVFLSLDLLFLACSFFDSWLNDDKFMVVQAIQIITNILVIIFMCIYFIFLKQEKTTVKPIRGDRPIRGRFCD